jgi:hypothetical protein
MAITYSRRLFVAILTCLTSVPIIGCRSDEPKTHEVIGRIELQAGEIHPLVGSTVEVALISEPTVRGFGEIQEDGRFVLNSLQGGELRTGVLEGRYAARILPSSEDDSTQKRAIKAIGSRYRQFQTSGLTFTAPSPEPVVLTLTAS